MQNKVTVVLLISVILLGCSGAQHCIKVGGEYQGAQGEIEYCYNAPASRDAGAPVLENAQGKSYVISADDLAAAVARIKELQPKPAASTTPPQSPVQVFLEFARSRK